MTRQTHRWVRGPDFPVREAEALDEMCDAQLPAVLLGEGDRPDAFEAPRVAIVGTRAATPHGLADARELAGVCARAGVTVVSGLAIGIDGAAHEGAIDAGGLTVGVVATGLDVVYPRRHARLYERIRAQGLVVGENPYGTQPLPWRFPVRNRIIAALADVVVIVESALTGGAPITARDGLRFDRKVFAIPGSRRNPVAAGCNALVADGAQPLLDPSDLLLALGRSDPRGGSWTTRTPPRDRDQRGVLRALGGDPASIDQLERRIAFPVERLGTALRALETGGHVFRKRGLWWPA